MQEAFLQFLRNKVLITTIFAWIIAQALKVVVGVIRYKRFDFRWFVGTGGMPSSHVTGASCLATAVGQAYGFDSAYFALAASFALVIMFDAQGVRRAAGRQARILNKISEDIYWKGKFDEEKLREFIGHTPVEVIVGFILGVVIALVAR
ncbi:MAG: divergent PAP2 family protein [Candidatus Omnitrophica bacterium]|nr:divergent PAP2 family protein [Candidatus Omnitrophota bacterium]